MKFIGTKEAQDDRSFASFDSDSSIENVTKMAGKS